ncbi:MAG: PQQ-binding-like beta-propeller repeat protein [Chloroflexi bacterium]|nr:PQQ-binding-like beta-propeller repeat protein [Chloroflexota bacterium]
MPAIRYNPPSFGDNLRNIGRQYEKKMLWVTAVTLLLLNITACGLNRSGALRQTPPEAFFSANLQRDGVYPSAAVKNPSGASWQFQAGEWVFTAPVVVDNTVYFGSYDGNLYAANAATGAELWRFPLATPSSPPRLYPAIMSYVGGMNGNLYAINRQTGQEHWQFATQGSILASPVIANGQVYTGSEDGEGVRHQRQQRPGKRGMWKQWIVRFVLKGGGRGCLFLLTQR